MLTLLETDVNCWNDAAQFCQNIAGKQAGKEAAEYRLKFAVYSKRAATRERCAAKVRLSDYYEAYEYLRRWREMLKGASGTPAKFSNIK